MTSVLSLGLHQPTALPYLTQERLVPQDPSPDSYTWQTLPSDDEQILGDDEVVTTKTAVVWSRGGIVRKSFRFEIEGEPVQQALLTHFFPEETTGKKKMTGQDGGDYTGEDTKSPNAQREKHRNSRALVVLLRTQAHIFYLSGTSHIIHLPFEVEHAIAAPNGIILQRRHNVGNLASLSLKSPMAPPHAYINTQTTQPWSAASSVHSTFSIASLGSPEQLKIPEPTIFDKLWPVSQATEVPGPRLYTLTDPLGEMGLIVTGAKSNPYKKSPLRAVVLDSQEEIVHISHESHSPEDESKQERPTLAVTMNRETMMYTIWRMEYVKHEDDAHKKAEIVHDAAKHRRRSSFMPTASDAETPVSGSPATFRDSFGGAENMRKQKTDGKAKAKKLDFVASLDPEAEATSTPRRKSRRVSSMLARADLSMSATHDRNLFPELLAAKSTLGRSNSQAKRASLVGYNKTFRSSIGASSLNVSTNSNLGAPVDNLLQSLDADGDIEGFGNMDLEDDDYMGMRKEVVFTKIDSIPARQSSLHFSANTKPAQSQCSVFTIPGPPDNPQKTQLAVCILDRQERRFIVTTLNISRSIHQSPSRAKFRRLDRDPGRGKEIFKITTRETVRAEQVIDACKVYDGDISRILVLSDSPDGVGKLTLQWPWGPLMRLSLPSSFAFNSLRSFNYNAAQVSQTGSLKRLLSDGPQSYEKVRNPLPGGIVDVVDIQQRLHQLHIKMEPRIPLVKQAIGALRYVLTGKFGDSMLVGWWNAHQWLGHKPNHKGEKEYSALVIMLFSLVLPYQKAPTSTPQGKHKGSRSSLLRTGSSSTSDVDDLADLLALESMYADPSSAWIKSSSWDWLDPNETSRGPGPQSEFLMRHIQLTRDFLESDRGHARSGIKAYLPTLKHSQGRDSLQLALDKILKALHAIHEDGKLDITLADSFRIGNPSLAPILSQMCRWVGWQDCAADYELEDAAMDAIVYDESKIMDISMSRQINSNIYNWIASALVTNPMGNFPTLTDIKYLRSNNGEGEVEEQCKTLTPRTCMFKTLFLKQGWTCLVSSSSAVLVENLCHSGFTPQVLGTLPEAILVPFREAITACQSEPEISWGKKLLSLVGREDVNMLLFSEHERISHPSLMVPTHEAGNDVATICAALSDPETVGPFDGVSEADRQAITRLIWKEDQRFSEAARILNPFKPTAARLIPGPEWTESDILEAQKVITQDLAYRTLAVPCGRGLLYFSARVPLLTEKFPINGFNLHCVFKGTNNTVAADKGQFTEEKVQWAFFHQGVATGLSISREAKGIDSSWILYNKPNEPSNRHAGFLLALGLNGHLKCVAKWMAFRYLTPKHTMTSIGLLLGLACSYIGTMDSLITRLLSVHVSRLLPSTAADLNLSSMTQTTGIMGIGLVYCNTQHRRMSEIMLSEIERVDLDDQQDGIRNESYRLGAGFALGYVNLGKGSDLRGLHDMHLTERLLKLAIGTKKIDLVHVLDKSTAGAMVAIAMIFMKTENQQLARKLEIPKSSLQFGYIRPDIFLLRTLARNLIMWSQIRATHAWIQESLPPVYRHNSDLTHMFILTTEDLPFYNILAGLCFSMALRFAGSGNVAARDLLVHYLDHLMRLCSIPAINYDQKLTRNTIRNCQDLLALCCTTVMAGSGDLIVFRRFRALRGREDADTPYGSHMVAHTAIGALFLGGGTHTFGTSNMAIASLIVAFYPLYPPTILDNRSHLQAFRHFWVLASEPRCVVARDVETNLPVSLPLQITLRPKRNPMDDVGPVAKLAPCLLPEVEEIASLTTGSGEYWPVCLNFAQNPDHLAAFKRIQTIYVKRRPAYDAKQGIFHATLQALDDINGSARQPLEWLWELDAFKGFTSAERALVLPSGEKPVMKGMEGTLVDTRLVLEKATLDSGKRDRLEGLRTLFDWADTMKAEGKEVEWIRNEVVEALKARVWVVSMDDGACPASRPRGGVGLGIS